MLDGLIEVEVENLLDNHPTLSCASENLMECRHITKISRYVRRVPAFANPKCTTSVFHSLLEMYGKDAYIRSYWGHGQTLQLRHCCKESNLVVLKGHKKEFNINNEKLYFLITI